MRLEFDSNVSSVSFSENELAENVAETPSAQTSELLREGIKAAQAGNRAVARVLLSTVTETDPHNENAWLWLASISEYPEELIIFLNNVLNVNPENARAKEWMTQTKSLLSKTFVQRGIDASKENQNDFAKQCFYQAAAHDNANELAWLWLASVSDDAEEKEVHLNKALFINPKNEDAQNALTAVQKEMAKKILYQAESAAEAGDRETAAELLREVFQKSPEMEEAWLFKARLTNDSSEKIRYYEKVLELNSENETAQTELKNIHHEQISTLLQNAKSAAFAGDSQTANQMLAEVLEKSPEMEEAWMLKSLLALGFDEKMSCFERVLEINPENEAAKSGLETLRAFMPKIETGKDEYSQMAEEFADEDFFAEESAGEEVQLIEETSFFTHHTKTGTDTEENTAAEFQLDTEVFSFTRELNLEETKETETFQNFAVEKVEDSNSFQESETSQPASEIYQFETDNDEKKDWAISETETASETLEAKEENDETKPHSAEVVEEKPAVKFVDFGLDKIEESPADTEKNEFTATDNSKETPQKFDVFEPKAETFEHQPTQLFDKPTADLSDEEFSFQPAAEPKLNGEDFQTSDAPEQLVEEVISVRKFSPEPAPGNSFFSNETADDNHPQTGYHETFGNNNFSNQNSFAEQNLSPATEELPVRAEEVLEKTAAESLPEIQEAAANAQPEGFSCPFCNVENDALTFACASCGAVLSLSDLEMLLANQNTDKEVLQNTVDRMEVEKTSRTFGEYELMLLGIGHINLKNLRQGFSYLQQASQINPNNVLLASQVNALAIRVNEIERQEEIHESMPKGRTILVVDDSPTVRKLISGKLEKSGHEVFCAVDGMDALAKLDEVVPDLILLDITMPRMDGYQVCKMIRNNDATKDIPVVMISGKDGFFDKVRGRMAGTTGYITKPFGPETLMKALDVYIKTDEKPSFDQSLSAEA